MDALKRSSDVTPNMPRLWVKRVVILKEPFLNENAVIRTITLERGLNIVWGRGHQDGANPETSAFTASGHSVGKSSFCRLLRYVLGEPQYGPPRHKEQLKKTYPNSWVAAEVYIDGVLWSVARSLVSSKEQYRVGKKLKIEDILPPNFTAGQTKADYMQALEGLVPGGLTLPSHKFTWPDILAWLTRDQSTRLRNFWTWREADDETAKRAFSHSVAHPQHLILGILKMLPQENEALQQTIHQLQQERNIAEGKVNSLQEQPKLNLDFAKNQVRILLADNIPIENENAGSLFSIEHRSRIWLEEHTAPHGKLAELKTHYDTLHPYLIAAEAVRNQHKDELEQYGIVNEYLADNMAAVKPADKSDALSKQIEDIKQKIQKLQSSAKYKCPYAKHVKIGECQEVQRAVGSLNDDLQKSLTGIINFEGIQRRSRQQKQYESYAESDKNTQQEKHILLSQYNEADEAYREAHNVLLTLKQQIDDLTSQVQRMNDCLTEMNKWQEAVDNEASFPELSEARTVFQKKTEELDLHKKALKEKQKQATGHSQALTELFSKLVEAICGSGYSGQIVDKGALRFHIENDGILDGAVSDTLAIILGDLTAMLGTGLNASHHPGFHLHDSPREANLGLVLYDKFLQLALSIHNQNGGETSAPFQYILTTTSTNPPPAHLKDLIRLELSADPPTDFLFGKKLRVKNDDVVMLF